MSNSLLTIIRFFAPTNGWRYVGARLRQGIVGFAHDFWKDGHWPKSSDDLDDIGGTATVAGAASSGAESALSTVQDGDGHKDDGLWHALPGEISEKMWGDLCVTPGDDTITERLIRPLGLNKDMNVLDLSAGLGARLRKTTEEFGVYINGLEPDPDIAARGMELVKSAGRAKHVTITHYDPMTLTSARSYDCVIARETIYRVADKAKFITAIASCCKKRAQISFTDYIVDPEFRYNPAIKAWQAFEQGAAPSSLVEMAELWAKHGFNLRVHDDQTDYYKKEIVMGLGRFAKFLASGAKPSPLTKKAINKRIAIWAHRIAAIEGGMKFYRFYGLR